jgi:hypothetical protein
MVASAENLLVVTAQVGNPGSSKQPDGQPTALMAGIHGELLVSEAGHGRFFQPAKRGNLFVGNTVIAGVALPVNAATLASKFTLWNPAGSGVDVELIEFAIGIDSATEVVDGLAVGIQPQVSTTGGPPTSLTELTTVWQGYGGTTPSKKAKLYSAATMTNAAVLTALMGLGVNFDATAVGLHGGAYAFDGKIVLPPDTIATFVSTVAAITAAFCSVSWSEWPA